MERVDQKELKELINGILRSGDLGSGKEFSMQIHYSPEFKQSVVKKISTPGGAGLTAQQDAPAFRTFNQKYHVTIMVSVDRSDLENGCLEVVYDGQHKKGILPQTADLSIDPNFEMQLTWVPVLMAPGDVLLFDSYIPQRSGRNNSARFLRAL